MFPVINGEYLAYEPILTLVGGFRLSPVLSFFRSPFAGLGAFEAVGFASAGGR